MNSLFDGIPELLADLRAAGVRLAVATSKAEPTAQRIIEHFGLDEHFEVVAGASLDGSRASKADVVAHALAQLEPLPDRVLMVGDRSHDVEGASEHGIDTVVVGWGYGACRFQRPRRRRPHWPTSRRWPTSARCSVSDIGGRAAPVSESVHVPLHITFICSGNICRSPMAEKMFAHQISERGLADAVRVTSAGTGGWHAGDPADHRASHVLRAHGYPTAHRAAQVDDDHLSADLMVALGRNHVRMLAEMGVHPDRLRMLRSFDPRSGAHVLDVEDPYYGDNGDFEEVFTVIDASLPGLHQWVDEQLASRGIAS